MIRSIVSRALLGATLVIVLPTAAAAQAERSTPEGTTWYLVSYMTDGELIQVPWYVDATLSLQDGQAGGSAGCNGFGASYDLDSDSLTFSDPGSTDVGCGKAWLDVEAGYLAALPDVADWAGDSGPTESDRLLYLYDEAGEIILTFQPPAGTLTRADVFALAAELDALRDRIRKLERQARRG